MRLFGGRTGLATDDMVPSLNYATVKSRGPERLPSGWRFLLVELVEERGLAVRLRGPVQHLVKLVVGVGRSHEADDQCEVFLQAGVAHVLGKPLVVAVPPSPRLFGPWVHFLQAL